MFFKKYDSYTFLGNKKSTSLSTGAFKEIHEKYLGMSIVYQTEK